MKICAAQIKPISGDIDVNIKKHLVLIAAAVAGGSRMIIFPELSLTGYEPELAEQLAISFMDSRLDIFQQVSDISDIIISIGVPKKESDGMCIGMLIFHPGKARQSYTKEFLHSDELPFFISGSNESPLITGTNIAPAICYELSVPEHAIKAFENGAGLYAASVAKSAEGVATAGQRLAAIAKMYAVPVLMCNCIGYCDNFEGAGSSAIWDQHGVVLQQLDQNNEGIIIFDTVTRQAVKNQFNTSV